MFYLGCLTECGCGRLLREPTVSAFTAPSRTICGSHAFQRSFQLSTLACAQDAANQHANKPADSNANSHGDRRNKDMNLHEDMNVRFQ